MEEGVVTGVEEEVATSFTPRLFVLINERGDSFPCPRSLVPGNPAGGAPALRLTGLIPR